ncbi:hypothetical protein KAI12_05265, partial [Candidatus Bathyarchaeota archaeon]|nr:hypothetical protein [Candidatus Bathyarchaeota archaeon]
TCSSFVAVTVNFYFSIVFSHRKSQIVCFSSGAKTMKVKATESETVERFLRLLWESIQRKPNPMNQIKIAIGRANNLANRLACRWTSMLRGIS